MFRARAVWGGRTTGDRVAINRGRRPSVWQSARSRGHGAPASTWEGCRPPAAHRPSTWLRPNIATSAPASWRAPKVGPL
jgi:hypothetical protein